MEKSFSKERLRQVLENLEIAHSIIIPHKSESVMQKIFLDEIKDILKDVKEVYTLSDMYKNVGMAMESELLDFSSMVLSTAKQIAIDEKNTFLNDPSHQARNVKQKLANLMRNEVGKIPTNRLNREQEKIKNISNEDEKQKQMMKYARELLITNSKDEQDKREINSSAKGRAMLEFREYLTDVVKKDINGKLGETQESHDERLARVPFNVDSMTTYIDHQIEQLLIYKRDFLEIGYRAKEILSSKNIEPIEDTTPEPEWGRKVKIQNQDLSEMFEK